MPDDRGTECVYVLADVAGSRLLDHEGVSAMMSGMREAERLVADRLGDRLLLPPQQCLGDSLVAVLRADAGEAGARAVLDAVAESMPSLGFHAGAARGILWVVDGMDAASLGGPALWAAEDAAGKTYPHGLKWRGWERECPCETLVSEP